jgi:hypothetical protein
MVFEVGKSANMGDKPYLNFGCHIFDVITHESLLHHAHI